jgi:hypothetical protein
MPMTDIEKARRLFRDAGLAFPTIPEKLAAQLKGARSMAFLHPANRDVALQPSALCDMKSKDLRPMITLCSLILDME